MFMKKLSIALGILLSLATAAVASQGTGCMPTTGTVTGLAFSQNINVANAAFISSNSGAAAPATDCTAVAIVGQPWLDTSSIPAKLRYYSGSTGGWEAIGILDNVNGVWTPPIGGGTNTLVSAATVDLCSVPQSNITISGTTTITSFSTTCGTGNIGQRKNIRFSGAVPLTYNATTLILPNAVSRTAVVGDLMEGYWNGTGWNFTIYTNQDGTPVNLPIATASVLGAVKQGSNITIAGDGTLSSNGNPIVRQTVLSGPQTAGVSSLFPTSSATLSITTQGVSGSTPIIATAAVGYGANGNVDVFGQSTANLTWSGLTANSTNYLYAYVFGGTLTPYSTTIAPIYQYGGTISVVSGQNTFDIAQMKMFQGNGTILNQNSIVFLGEVLTSGTAVSSTVTYAYNGYYDSGFINTLPSSATSVSKNSNLGTTEQTAIMQIKNLTTESGYSVGDIVLNPSVRDATSSYFILNLVSSRLTTYFITGSISNIGIQNKATGTYGPITSANWAYRVIARRSWGGS